MPFTHPIPLTSFIIHARPKDQAVQIFMKTTVSKFLKITKNLIQVKSNLFDSKNSPINEYTLTLSLMQ